MATTSPRQQWWLAVVPGAIAFVIYFMTACRTVYIGDAGEFALALESFGICHPPGYPLFTILGRIFIALMPFFRPVFAAGIFNILIASAAVSFIYLIFRRTLGAQTAFALSMIWAFTPIFWGRDSRDRNLRAECHSRRSDISLPRIGASEKMVSHGLPVRAVADQPPVRALARSRDYLPVHCRKRIQAAESPPDIGFTDRNRRDDLPLSSRSVGTKSDLRLG